MSTERERYQTLPLEVLRRRRTSALLAISMENMALAVTTGRQRETKLAAIVAKRERLALIEQVIVERSAPCEDQHQHDAHDLCPGRKAAVGTMIGRVS